MRKQSELKILVREVINIIVKFCKPYGLKDEVVETPKKMKIMGYKVAFLDLVMTIISLSFAFMLKGTNLLIEHRMIILGIMVFMLYRGQRVVKEAFRLYERTEREKFDQIFEDEIILRGSKIIGKTSGKVMKLDSSTKLYKVMSNESALNTIKGYLRNLWDMKINHIFNVLEILSVIVMIVVAIVTNTEIPQKMFIPLILIFVVISFFSSAYVSRHREMYYKKGREFRNEQAVIVNDLLRIPNMVSKDLEMRIGKLQNAVTSNNKNVVEFHKKMNYSYLVTTILEAFSQYGIIVMYLLGVDWSNISLATITEITATLLIAETALGYTGSINGIMNRHNEIVTVLEKEEDDMKLILEAYHKEVERTSKPQEVEKIEINPFSIQYMEESKNDKPFTLVSESQIRINSGEVAILYGPSGSGKSTFMKLLTERIMVEKSTEIPSTSRYMFYDEKLRFGSLSIYEELFCCETNPKHAKMQEILENLHLWSEIKSNCIDVWKWMQEKQFERSLSNGQKQRLILAKMLYWLDDEIDVMVLDECTSGLDDKVENDAADAERILEYIVRYCNKDKKRIVIIATHQNIDGFKENLGRDYKFRDFQFMKDSERNLIKEIA